MVYAGLFQELDARLKGVIELSQIVRDLFARNQNSLCSSSNFLINFHCSKGQSTKVANFYWDFLSLNFS